MFSICVLLLQVVALVVAQDTSLSTVKRSFDDANIPETISLTFDPKILLEVTFPEPSGEPIVLHAGIQLPRNATAGPPSFGVEGTTSKPGPFVLAAIDPDVPTPQNQSVAQVRHFLGGNFVFENTGSNIGPRLVNTTPAVTEFAQPRPRAGSDPHRYIFLLFEQPEEFNNQNLITPATPVTFFNLSSFASGVGLGQPIGGTFMLVGPDPSPA